jgi:hypothetical protein
LDAPAAGHTGLVMNGWLAFDRITLVSAADERRSKVMTVSAQHGKRKRGYRRLDNELSPAFVRNVAKSGRYSDVCSRFPASDS